MDQTKIPKPIAKSLVRRNPVVSKNKKDDGTKIQQAHNKLPKIVSVIMINFLSYFNNLKFAFLQLTKLLLLFIHQIPINNAQMPKMKNSKFE